MFIFYHVLKIIDALRGHCKILCDRELHHLALMGNFKYTPPKTKFCGFSDLETFEELGQLCRHDSAGAHGDLVTLHTVH